MTAAVPLPHPPCDACLSDPACRLETPLLLAVWCRHRQSGAHFDGARWTVYVPVPSDVYVALLMRLEERTGQALQVQRQAAGATN
jgi:hypothetical protein